MSVKNVIVLSGAIFFSIAACLVVDDFAVVNSEDVKNAKNPESADSGKSAFVVPLTDIPNLDPHSGNEMNLNFIAEQVFGRLIEFGRGLKLIPSLATWKIDPRRKAITFYIDKNARFHDGSIIRSVDVVNSLERSAAKGTPLKSLLGPNGDCSSNSKCRAISIVDVSTFEIKFWHQEFRPLLYALASMEGSILKTEGGRLIGSGPYRVDHLDDNHVYLVSTREGLSIDRIKYLKIDPETALELFQAGEIHFLNSVQFPVSVDPVNGQEIPVHHMGTYYLSLSFRSEILRSLDVRKAIYHGLDRSKLAKAVCGHTEAATTFISKGLQGYTHSAFFSDNSQARITISNGSRPISLNLGYRDKFSESLSGILSYEFSKIGIKLKVFRLPFDSLLERHRRGDIDIVIKGDGIQNYDLSTMYVSYISGSNSNVTGYSSKELDTLVSAIGFNMSEMSDTIPKVENHIVKNAVLVPICYPQFRRWFANSVSIPPTVASGLQTWNLPIQQLSWK